MQGLLETQGLTVTGHLEHGQVKVTPSKPTPYLEKNKNSPPSTNTALLRRWVSGSNLRKYIIILLKKTKKHLKNSDTKSLS
jgi:hypothetical protein